jgi:hypothetical protein
VVIPTGNVPNPVSDITEVPVKPTEIPPLALNDCDAILLYSY